MNLCVAHVNTKPTVSPGSTQHFYCRFMFRRVVVLLISQAVIVACLDNRGVKADPAGAVVATTTGDSSFVLARSRYIDAGDAFTCVILDDSAVKCFGLGADGQLGLGGTANVGDGVGVSVSAAAAIALGSGRTARAIATGSSHACALLDDYSVKCWGSGIYGRLGYGDTTSRGTTSLSMGDSLAALEIGTGRSARMITAGAQHTCALLDNGSVKCWGRGASGQLGYGSTQTRGDEPNEMGDSLAAIAFGSGQSARAISAGANHTCALLTNYTVKCWGDNSYGQLGQGNLTGIGDGVGTSVSASTSVALGSGRTARAISAGDSHTCALLDNGSVKCWGAGANGRLGSGGADDLGDGSGEMGDSLISVSLGAGRTALAISAGSSHTCALLDNYAVKCWGSGADGRLGYGNQNDLGDNPSEMGDALSEVSLGSGRTARAIVAAGAHTCAILDNHTVKCWGNGGSGRRGSESTLRAGHTSLTMGDYLPAIDLGSGRSVSALTEPGRPTSLSATAGDSQASLSWSAPTVNGGSAVTDYVIESSVDGGSTWTIVSDTTSTATSASISGLNNATSYRFRVSAVNSVAMGAVSGTPTAVTPVATSVATTAPIATTTSTTSTTSTTTPLAATRTAPSSTSTTSTTILHIEPTSVGVIQRLVLPSFAANVSSLSAQQRQRLVSYSAKLRRGDKVTCVGYATPNPLRVVSLLSVRRAESVCAYLAKRVRGIVTKIDAQFHTIARNGPNRAAVVGPSTNLVRRVVVLATKRS